ncbi:MAG TPA: CoA transferase [Acidimicrobiales bacterium]|nr:CoA transferase [Acidimicrobiales bacterium]
MATEHPPAPIPPGDQAQVLSGLRVIEIGQYVAAPLAATIFADLGASVAKVERPGGDPLRADPVRFAAWNRGKDTVELDLRSEDGRTALLELVDGADLVVENLRPGALERLGLALAALRTRRPRLVTCSISAWGSGGPSRDEPGWEPLVHARAGAQQGLFTGDDPIWLPFPVASVSAALVAVMGAAAALIKRASTGYGQHVETSLLDALLFLNAAAIFHREGHRPRIVRQTKSPILRIFDTSDERAVMVNLSGTERWRELCRVLGIDDGGLDYSTPEGLSKLSDREWNRSMLQRVIEAFGSRTADEWETALLAEPAAVAKCNSLAEWLAHDQSQIDELVVERDDPVLGRVPLVGPPVRISVGVRAPQPSRRRGGEHGALGGHRIVDLSSFWAGPLASRLLAELGADVIKVEPPGGEGGFQMMPVLPNIYVDANRSKRGIVLDLKTPEDRARLLDLVAASDVVVENAMAGAWERLGLDEGALRAVNPNLVYARAKGFGTAGPLAARPSFDYVVQAATGMEMTQGGGARPVPVNFTANDYGTGLLLGAGVVLALLGRSRGAAVTSVHSSLALTATLLQSEDVAALAVAGVVPNQVGSDLLGASQWRRLYRAKDGWVTVCCVTDAHRTGLLRALGLPCAGDGKGASAPGVEAVADAVQLLTVESVLSALRSEGVPAAASVHPSAVPDDPQVVARELLRRYRHPAAGRFVQVGLPLSLSVDAPAVKGPAPTPAPVRRRVKKTSATTS